MFQISFLIENFTVKKSKRSGIFGSVETLHNIRMSGPYCGNDLSNVI